MHDELRESIDTAQKAIARLPKTGSVTNTAIITLFDLCTQLAKAMGVDTIDPAPDVTEE